MATKQKWVFVRDFARNVFRFDFQNDFVRVNEMEQFTLKVGRCFAFIFNQLGGGGGGICFVCYWAQPFIIERALAIVQQCNDHNDKRSLERSHC